MFYDAHNHLGGPVLAPHQAQIFRDLTTACVTRAVVNGTDESDWPEVARLAREHAVVLPSYGLHPWDVGNRTTSWLESLRGYLLADRRAAVGEIGLDRWMLERARPDDPRLAGMRRAPLDEQVSVFTAQLDLAFQLRRPVTVHCIDAFGLLLETLQSLHAAQRLPARGFLLHAYSGSGEMVKSFHELGAYFSFNAAYLAPRHRRLREVFQSIPFDCLLIETDAPAMRPPAEHETFLPLLTPDGSPVHHPANLAAGYVGLAALRQIPLEVLIDQVSENFHRLFG